MTRLSGSEVDRKSLCLVNGKYKVGWTTDKCIDAYHAYSSRAKVSGRAANDPGFVKVSQNSILRISINIHCTAGELYS